MKHADESLFEGKLVIKTRISFKLNALQQKTRQKAVSDRTYFCQAQDSFIVCERDYRNKREGEGEESHYLCALLWFGAEKRSRS